MLTAVSLSVHFTSVLSVSSRLGFIWAFAALHGCCYFQWWYYTLCVNFCAWNFYSSIIIVCCRLSSTPISLSTDRNRYEKKRVYATAHFRHIPTDRNLFLGCSPLYSFHFHVYDTSFLFIFAVVLHSVGLFGWFYFYLSLYLYGRSLADVWRSGRKTKPLRCILCWNNRVFFLHCTAKTSENDK